jgi:hypothetical protein
MNEMDMQARKRKDYLLTEWHPEMTLKTADQGAP